MPFNQNGMKQAKLRTLTDLIKSMEDLKDKNKFLFGGENSKIE